jgi:hypothetical protein
MYRQCSHSEPEKEFGNQCACALEDKRMVDVEAGTVDLSGFSKLVTDLAGLREGAW